MKCIVTAGVEAARLRIANIGSDPRLIGAIPDTEVFIADVLHHAAPAMALRILIIALELEQKASWTSKAG